MQLNLIKKLFILSIAFSGVFLSPARADLETVGYTLKTKDVVVEVTSGDFNSEEDVAPTVDALSEVITKEHQENPEAFFELGWANTTEENGSTHNLAKRILTKLSSRGVEADRAMGVQTSTDWYLNHSLGCWTLVRMVNSGGLKLGTLLFIGHGLGESLALSAPVAFAASLTGIFYTPILTFANKTRVYDYLKPEKHPRLFTLLQNPKFKSRLDWAHGKLNWGFLDLLFYSTIVLGDEAVRGLLHLQTNLPTVGAFAGDFLPALASQQIWDRAVKKYQDLLELDPSHSEKFIKANVRKRGSIGSIIAVLGFNALASESHTLKIAGYLTLGVLGVAGRIYEKRIDAKIARKLKEINGCELALESD